MTNFVRYDGIGQLLWPKMYHYENGRLIVITFNRDFSKIVTFAQFCEDCYQNI